jgi:hypothetical protein
MQRALCYVLLRFNSGRVERLISVPRLTWKLEVTTICQTKIDVVAFKVAWHEKSALNPAAFFSALTTGQHELEKSVGASNITPTPKAFVDLVVLDRQGEDTLYTSRNLAFRPPCCHPDESAEICLLAESAARVVGGTTVSMLLTQLWVCSGP